MRLMIILRMSKTLAKVAPAVTLAFLLIIAAGSAPASAQVDSDQIPGFFMDFMVFYSSGDIDQMAKYVHPDRGLIQNSFLLTYDEVKEDFQALGKTNKNIQYMKVIFNYGYFLSEDYYRATCWVEYRAADYTQQVPTVFVFENIDGKWYLVQTEMIEFFDQFRQFEILSVGFVPEIEAETSTGRLYKSLDAAKAGKATVLYFFSLMDIYGEVNLEFYLDVMKKYGKRNDIFLFAVTDDNKTDVDAWMKRNGLNFVYLSDEKSLVHYDLGILIHPMILVLDKDGRLVMMTSWKYPRDIEVDENYRTPSQGLVLDMIDYVLSKPAVTE